MRARSRRFTEHASEVARVLETAINPRMHFALAAVRWRTTWRRRTTVALVTLNLYIYLYNI